MQPPSRLAVESLSAKAQVIRDLAARVDRLGADLDGKIAMIEIGLSDPAKVTEVKTLRDSFA